MILYVYSGKQHKGKNGETLVKKALKDYSNNMYKNVVIKRGIHGKPFFDNIPIHFSISHSGNIWVCLMADFTVGIDIQIYKDLKYEKVSQRFFSDSEIEFIKMHGIDAFFQVWARKEAYVKYTGNGFTEGFSQFSVINNCEDGHTFYTEFKDAYFSPINLELDKLNLQLKEKIVSVACTRQKEHIIIKRLLNEV